jgi:hypothetical protein
MNNINARECNHFLCLMSTPWKASFIVTRFWDNGQSTVTYACKAHMDVMSEILSGTYTIENVS